MTLAVIAGALANKPRNGGAAWTRLSWVLGFAQTGFDVHLVEQLDVPAAPGTLAWWDAVVGDFGLEARATLLAPDGSTLRGLARPDLEQLCAEAALLLDISGHLRDSGLRNRARVRVYLDLDPGYTQLWAEQGLIDLSGHDHHVTVGLGVGTDACALPTAGIAWRPTLQPVLLDRWPRRPPPGEPRFTTVAAWRGPYGTVERDGLRLGPKAHQLRRFLPLPARAPGTFELALQIAAHDEGDRAALRRHGWRLVDPDALAGTPAAFRSYVQGSAAELSVAQGMYVETRCGWFSDRSTRYLATGRPVVLQDTGFARHLPVGEGLLVFDDLDGAVAACEELLADTGRHERAARKIAEELFAADVVVGRLCEEAGVAP